MNKIGALLSPDCCEKEAVSPSILDTLKRSKLSLESRLDNVNKAIEALEENPSVLKVLELVSKAR